MDANATTPPLPEVVAAVQLHWSSEFGNASAVHSHGRAARESIDTAREHVASLLRARSAEITFTSGGTEADNLALFGTLRAGGHLITSSSEHHAVLHAAEALRELGVELTILQPDRLGLISPEQVSAAMRPNTRLVSLMLANNETGVLQPLTPIADLAHAHGALLHTDAVQACGKISVDVRELGCDLLTLSAHKMHGPQGAGALWTRKGVELRPMLHGGPQERRRRAGTENVAASTGCGAAAAAAAAWLRSGGPEQLCTLRSRLESLLRQGIPETTIHGQDAARLPNTTCVSFSGVDAEALIMALDLKGLAISAGSACQSGAVEPSHVLRSIGLSDAEARSTVRISLSRMNTLDEVDQAVAHMGAAVERLRSLAA